MRCCGGCTQKSSNSSSIVWSRVPYASLRAPSRAVSTFGIYCHSRNQPKQGLPTKVYTSFKRAHNTWGQHASLYLTTNNGIFSESSLPLIIRDVHGSGQPSRARSGQVGPGRAGSGKGKPTRSLRVWKPPDQTRPNPIRPGPWRQ